MFLRAIEEIVLYVKTFIKVFLLDINANARMIGHAFLGRFRDEPTDSDTVAMAMIRRRRINDGTNREVRWLSFDYLRTTTSNINK